MTSALLVEEAADGDDQGEPVDVVGDDGAVGGRVGPAEDSLEDAPAAIVGHIGVAALFGSHWSA